MENFKIGYVFDTMTGELLGTETVWLEKATGEFPCAANVTFKKPPEPQANKRPIWNGKKWELVCDYRGKVIYSQEGIPVGVVDYLGELHDGEIIQEPPVKKLGLYEKLSWNGKGWDVTIERGCIRDGENIRPMTHAEMVTAGLAPLPEGYKIEKGNLVQMTKEELLEQGKITLAEYNEYVRQMREAEYMTSTDKIGLMVLRGEATKQEWEDAIQAVKDKWPYKEA